ncbi:hypothetical protein JCM10449v2_001937 [Rhodotorula kratochvilovae]
MAQRFKAPATAQQADQAVTLQTSLQQVKALLEAGIGCVAYLRGLLPEDSFEDYKLLAPRPPVSRSNSSTTVSKEEREKSNAPSSVRVKKLKRGASVEADKLLDYLELGATEAIEKGYLHQLIFAIYLDPDEPTNLVESYTFTFTYDTDAHGNKASWLASLRPELTVQDQLSGMVISSSAYGSMAREAPRKEGDVKRQVQQMIKNLITSTQVLDELPRRRFLNLRLFYTDDTPPSYEPPCFRPVAIDAPGYTLTTPSVGDPPDFGTLGNVATGFHGVALHSVSIAHVLDTPFDEHINLDEALARNRLDAASRPVVWNAESLAESATDDDAKLKVVEPLAVRDPHGGLHSIEEVCEGADGEMAELRKRVGIEQSEEAVVTARGLAEETICDTNLSDNTVLRRAIASTEKRAPSAGALPTQLDPVISRQKSCLPPVPLFDESAAQYQQRVAEQQQPIAGSSKVLAQEEEVVNEKRDEAKKAKETSPPFETQLFEYSQMEVDDALDTGAAETTFESEPDTTKTLEPTGAAALHSIKEEIVRPRRKSTRSKMRTAEDACECGDKEEDEGMICCSTCDVWKHAVCYGFEGVDDKRIPDVFTCYRCLAGAAVDEATHEPEREGEIEQALAEFRSLALFRRAIAVVWQEGVLSMKALADRLAVDNSTASQVLKRLKAEEYIVEQGGSSRRQRGKNGSQVGSLKTAPLVVNKSSKQLKRKKAEYFTPGSGAELGVFTLLRPVSEIDQAAAAPPTACPNGHAALASTSKPVAPAVLVEPTPPPAQQQQHAFGAPSSSAVAVSQDDPIQDDSQPLPFSTPDTVASTASSAAHNHGMKPVKRYTHEEQLEMPPASYVPAKGDTKGKARAVESEDDFPRGLDEHIMQKPVPMDVDDSIAFSSDFPPAQQQPHALPAADTSAGTSTGKRRSMGDLDPNAGGARAKRQKCSEASEIEV